MPFYFLVVPLSKKDETEKISENREVYRLDDGLSDITPWAFVIDVTNINSIAYGMGL